MKSEHPSKGQGLEFYLGKRLFRLTEVGSGLALGGLLLLTGDLTSATIAAIGLPVLIEGLDRIIKKTGF